MSAPPRLHWLPADPEFRSKLRALPASGEHAFAQAIALANTNLDFVATNALDEMLRRVIPAAPTDIGTKPMRLAVLGSSTTTHLLPALRVAGLRRGMWLTTYESGYGQYWQELLDLGSALHAFKPDALLFALDAHHLTQGVANASSLADRNACVDDVMSRLQRCWELARSAFKGLVLQQTVVNVFPAVLGNNEHRLPGSQHAMVGLLNRLIREAADAASVDVIAIDDRVVREGLQAWHNAGLWHRSKQEISPVAAPFYGDLVARVLAAKQGRSKKCLVLDLDNTLWGGVIGDDGLDGIVLGQGSALGEGFAAVQHYALQLSRRGIILAVSSKNDEANALEPFEKHPEMLLRRKDIASFRADWNDKAANIRAIAHDLNIGLDALVFLDDNPFERSLVRSELPMVAVPEIPDDPSAVPQVLADAGYFESVAITDEDQERAGLYQRNIARESLKASSTDLESYLRGLEMRMFCKSFDMVGLQRTVQLINKTNQFNLTTRRYTQEDVEAVMADANAFGLQLRLLDRFGDNGIIAIVIGRKLPDDDVEIDTWLMSCRVLGRQVERTTLNLIAKQALALGGRRLVGRYIATAKNEMVRNHYPALGFTVQQSDAGANFCTLELSEYRSLSTFIDVQEE